MMKMSFHRRRQHESLPPRHARSPKLVIIIGLLLSATVAFAASRFARAEETPAAPGVQEANARTEALVEDRLRTHLRGLSSR